MGGYGGQGGFTPSSSESTPAEPPKPAYTAAPARKPTSSRAMKLGGNARDVDSFVDQLESAGTCNGDSGGPLYLQKYKSGEGNKYVLTGAVSGGRGITGNCGGINNPTHYVRVKEFHAWIKSYAGEDTNWC